MLAFAQHWNQRSINSGIAVRLHTGISVRSEWNTQLEIGFMNLVYNFCRLEQLSRVGKQYYY